MKRLGLGRNDCNLASEACMNIIRKRCSPLWLENYSVMVGVDCKEHVIKFSFPAASLLLDGFVFKSLKMSTHIHIQVLRKLLC